MQLQSFINSEKFETHTNLGLKHPSLKHSGHLASLKAGRLVNGRIRISPGNIR